MDFPTYNACKQHLLAVLLELAPTGIEQRKVVDFLHRMELGDQRSDYKYILRSLARAIEDAAGTAAKTFWEGL